jgi:hypothetical protein
MPRPATRGLFRKFSFFLPPQIGKKICCREIFFFLKKNISLAPLALAAAGGFGGVSLPLFAPKRRKNRLAAASGFYLLNL